MPEKKRQQFFDAARACIDKTIGLLYHFTVYLYHVSNGSPKKMRMNFENRIRPLRNKCEFKLTKKQLMNRSPLEGEDVDFNFTLDESQSVKRHYMEIQRKHLLTLKEEKIYSL